METVPDDILVLVLCHLDLEDVLACSRVSHRFHELTGRDQIWSKLCDDFRCEPAVQAEDVPALWSQVFKDRCAYGARLNFFLDEGPLGPR